MKYVLALLFTIAFSSNAMSQQITTEDLVGKKVSTVVKMLSHSRKGSLEIHGQTRMSWELTFGPGGTITGEQSRIFSVGGQVKGRDARRIKANISKPRQYLEGHSVWILEGATLTRLSTVKTGAFKLTITFTKMAEKWTCQAENTMAREVGKGTTRSKGIATESQRYDVDIVSIKQISSSCSVTM